jgi:hypothetical protein
LIDEIARAEANRWGVPENLHIAVAAVDEEAISRHVGKIVRVLSGAGRRTALLVAPHPAPPADLRFPIWDHPAATTLREPEQIWVHIAYTRYRAAFRRARPDADLGPVVVSHALNRRVAALQGFGFVRVTLTSRVANSSSAFSEGWGVTHHSDPVTMARNQARGWSVRYADLTELMLMLDMNLGGGVMQAVNDGQALIRPRTAS